VQERLTLQTELHAAGLIADLEHRERAFVAVARRVSERRGLTYREWRAQGVPAAVLARAGIARTGGGPVDQGRAAEARSDARSNASAGTFTVR
jgi:hypothetical protein